MHELAAPGIWFCQKAVTLYITPNQVYIFYTTNYSIQILNDIEALPTIL